MDFLFSFFAMFSWAAAPRPLPAPHEPVVIIVD
jgi:hypothetical protein